MINLLFKKIKKKTQLSHLLLRHLASRRFTNVHNLSDCSENPGSCWALRIIENQWILSIQKVRYVSKIQRYTIKVLQCICALFKNLFMTDCFSLQSIKPLVLKPKEACIYMQVTLETHYVALNTTMHILLLFFVLLFSCQTAFRAIVVFSAHYTVISFVVLLYITWSLKSLFPLDRTYLFLCTPS